MKAGAYPSPGPFTRNKSAAVAWPGARVLCRTWCCLTLFPALTSYPSTEPDAHNAICSSTMSRKVIVTPTSSVSHVPRQTFARGALNGLWAIVLAALIYYALFQLPFCSAAGPTVVGFVTPSASIMASILAMAGLLAAVALLYVLQRHRACEPRIVFPLDSTVPGRRSAAIGLAALALPTQG